ncbi:rhomboid family intramembrane serine protease [Rhodococcus spongiicola]|uniref:Rhomboid family intramembrane serine protease n=1 Tax=Rhodococcus spongiicola TaxID=2487352 RepID=A0A3S3BIV0_9NOCA|nr:rhomboid family intramembrane serine protease [Rhodococcus spongiicola]RVW02325.1 rhomboid family intramembrane serine protease [Rhodococcus spongiicola]
MTNPGWGGAASEGTPPPQSRCARHPDRPTVLSCSRCGRPACPDCLRSAPVGHQCVDCVSAGRRDTPRARTVAGAAMRSGSPVPVATYALIALNVLFFMATAIQAGSLMNNGAGVVNRFTGAATFDSSLFGELVLDPLAVAQGEWYRVVGSGFLHFGLIHLAINMFVLWILGRDTEMVLGRSRYLAVYFVSLLGGSASALAFESLGAFTAGASGAIFGIMGAQAVLLVRMRRSAGPVLTIIGLNIVISLTVPGISLWGHLGGLVAGAAATAVLVYAPTGQRTPAEVARARQLGWAGIAAIGVLVVGVIALRVVGLRDQLNIA